MSMKELNQRIVGMRCIKCGSVYPVDDYFYGCPSCLSRKENAPLTFLYRGERKIDTGKKGFKRYGQFLPYEEIPSLGEGATPVIGLCRMAKELGVKAIYAKNEFQNPTGSHKDRMNPFIVKRAREMGYRGVTCASSGNEAASLAAYAAAAGLECLNVSTRNIPFVWKNASNACGAKLVLVDNPSERLTYQKEHMDEGWYCATNLETVPISSSPFGIQGYKTISYELYEEFGSNLPDVIMIPACRGDLLYGIYEGFADLAAEGLIEKIPRLGACEPFKRLEGILEEGMDHRDVFPGDSSMTASIGGTTQTYQSEYALRKSLGFAVNAKGADVRESMRRMGSYGLFLESSSAIVYDCVKKALEQGKIGAEDSLLLVLTSNGYKSEIEV